MDADSSTGNPGQSTTLQTLQELVFAASFRCTHFHHVGPADSRLVCLAWELPLWFLVGDPDPQDGCEPSIT